MLRLSYSQTIARNDDYLLAYFAGMAIISLLDFFNGTLWQVEPPPPPVAPPPKLPTSTLSKTVHGIRHGYCKDGTGKINLRFHQ